MKLLKIVSTIVGIAILIILLVTSLYLYNSGPQLPEKTDDIIDNVSQNPLPELVTGKTGYATSQGLDIWYESITPEDSTRGTILLIMGISNDAMGWPPSFIDALVHSGYRVIRYDHRGTGLSDWMENWDSEHSYSLADMAADGVAVLDSVGVQKAHILGISMGGMIAQELAIHYPDRVASLVSMMSSCYIEDTNLPPVSSEVAWKLIKVSLKYGLIGGEKNIIKLHLASRLILMGDTNQNLDIKGITQQVLYNLRRRNGYNSSASRQHQAAVRQSGSRYDELGHLNIPTLIVHGKSDPFIPIEHGKKCASLIPNADSLWIDEMGHGIPEELIDTVVKKIITKF